MLQVLSKTSRCPQAISFLRFSTIARPFHHTSILAAESEDVKAKNEDGQSAAGKRVISLLEELFPQTNSSNQAKAKSKVKRHVPRIALEIPIPTDEPASIEPRSETTDAPSFERARHNRGIACLVLRKAGKFLTKADFRRVVPGAKHIEGWTRKGNILNVIRGRDATTLDPDGAYILIFENPASAIAYKEHVLRLHRLSKTYIPGGNNFAGAIPPPPLLQPDGRLAYTHETYTLLPPSQELDINLYIQPFSPLLRQVIDHAGYAPLVDDRRSDHEVLLAADWGQLSISALSRAIAEDGRRRGIHWAAISNRTAIRELRVNPGGSTSRPLDSSDADNEAKGKPRGNSHGLRADGRRRFIISFLEYVEAKRFALAWHQRDIAWLLESVPSHRERVMTQAEVIW